MGCENRYIYDVAALKENNVLGVKIMEARKASKMSQKDIAARLTAYNIRVSSGAVSKWEKGDSLPNPYQLFALCHILHIKDLLSYFMNAEVENGDLDAELNQKGQDLLQLVKEALISSGQYSPRSSRMLHSIPEPEVDMRVFDEPAAAGPGNFLMSGSYETISYPASTIPEGTDFGIRVSGISMLPRYVDSQVAWVEQCSELSNGETGVFFYDDNAYIKKFVVEQPGKEELEEYTDTSGCIMPKITLYSLNRECANLDVIVRPGHSFYIVGRVLN